MDKSWKIDPWKFHGQSDGKTMETQWKIHGKSMGNPWKIKWEKGNVSVVLHGVPMGAHGDPWAPMRNHGFPWVPMGPHVSPCVPMGFHGFPWVPMGPMGPHGVPMGPHGVPMGSPWVPWVKKPVFVPRGLANGPPTSATAYNRCLDPARAHF